MESAALGFGLSALSFLPDSTPSFGAKTKLQPQGTQRNTGVVKATQNQSSKLGVESLKPKG